VLVYSGPSVVVEKALSTDDETMQSFQDCWRETGLALLQGDGPSSSCNFNLHIDVHQLQHRTDGNPKVTWVYPSLSSRYLIDTVFDLHQPELSCTELSLDSQTWKLEVFKKVLQRVVGQ
jgi:hypothetical protein